MKFLLLFVVFLLSVIHSCDSQATAVGVDGSTSVNAVPEPLPNITFYIEHRVGNNEFHPRTRIQLIPKADGRHGLLYLDKNTIHGEDTKYFKSLIQQKDLYTIRIRSEKEDFQGHFVITSIPVCDLQRSAFKEDIQVFLDANGNIMGVSYTTPKMTIAHECDASKIKDSVSFQTRIKLGEETHGQVIPLQVQSGRPAYLGATKLGLEEEKQAPKQQQQSFFSRYWYLIVIFMLFQLFAGGGGGGAAEAGKEGGAPAAGNAAPAQ
eukprot:gene2187-2328_t